MWKQQKADYSTPLHTARIHQSKSLPSNSGLSTGQVVSMTTSPHRGGNLSPHRNFHSAWCIFRHYLPARIRNPNAAEPPNPLSKTREPLHGLQDTGPQNTEYPRSIYVFLLLSQHCVNLKASIRCFDTCICLHALTQDPACLILPVKQNTWVWMQFTACWKILLIVDSFSLLWF